MFLKTEYMITAAYEESKQKTPSFYFIDKACKTVTGKTINSSKCSWRFVTVPRI